mmetsp:Transcript_26634/g.58383  ORF Transcript_26634/g.58383 Transcript_26634/m.58383 type:complete len:281 (+) Transcript_26634:646-1488(+)
MTDIVFLQSAIVTQRALFECRELIFDRNANPSLNLPLNIFNGIFWIHDKINSTSIWRPDFDLHWLEFKRVFVFDPSILQAALFIFKKVAPETQALVFPVDSCVTLHPIFDRLDAVKGIDHICPFLAVQINNIDFHWLQLNHIVVTDIIFIQRASVMQWAVFECRELIFNWNTNLTLHLLLDIFNGVFWIHNKIKGMSIWGPDFNFHWFKLQCIFVFDPSILQANFFIFKRVALEAQALVFPFHTRVILHSIFDTFDGIRRIDRIRPSLAIRIHDIDFHLL